MARKKTTREEQLVKLAASIEDAANAMYPQTKKGEPHTAKAYEYCQKAVAALREACNEQRRHNEGILAKMQALKAEF